MKIINSIIRFIKSGFSTLSIAGRGKYREHSPYIRQLIAEEEASVGRSGIAIDKENLRRDRKMVARDMNNAFRKYKLANGYE